MKFFLYSSMVDPAKMEVPLDWYGNIHLTSDKKIIALDESIADRPYNISKITNMGLKDIYILQNSFLEVIKNADKFGLIPNNITFDVEVEEECFDEVKHLFRNGEFVNAADLILQLMNEYECEIKSASFFDTSVDEMVEVSNTGVIYVLGNFNVNKWFEKAYYFYALSDYRLPDDAGGLFQ